jgi:cation:H+ antiporter
MFLETFLYISALLAGFVFLIKGADYFIASASLLAERLGIQKFIIGLTMVAVGTSLPELFTSLVALMTSEEAPSFILGTVVGSNIANILLVFGLLLVLSTKLRYSLRILDTVFLILATLLLLVHLYFGIFTPISAFLFLLLLGVYTYSIIKGKAEVVMEEVEEAEESRINHWKGWQLFLLALFSLVLLNLGARAIIYSIENLGVLLGIPIEFLTLTTIAFATSLPEIVVTLTAVKKRQTSMAIGNLIGSNISNILLILGVSGLFTTLSFSATTFLISGLALAGATILFLIAPYLLRYQRIYGLFLLLAYVTYIVFIF